MTNEAEDPPQKKQIKQKLNPNNKLKEFLPSHQNPTIPHQKNCITMKAHYTANFKKKIFLEKESNKYEPQILPIKIENKFKQMETEPRKPLKMEKS